MKESTLQKQITDYIKKSKGFSVKIIASNMAGTPDILCCYQGKFIGIEVKNPNGKGVVSKLQNYRIKEIKKAGGIAVVVTSLQEVKDLFNEMEY